MRGRRAARGSAIAAVVAIAMAPHSANVTGRRIIRTVPRSRMVALRASYSCSLRGMSWGGAAPILLHGGLERTLYCFTAGVHRGYPPRLRSINGCVAWSLLLHCERSTKHRQAGRTQQIRLSTNGFVMSKG